MSNIECGQNHLVCLMLIRGDEGVDIDIREECGCEMGEKNSEAGNGASVRPFHTVCCQWDLAGVEVRSAKLTPLINSTRVTGSAPAVRSVSMSPDCGVQQDVANHCMSSVGSCWCGLKGLEPGGCSLKVG
jgi:hypothetical protein